MLRLVVPKTLRPRFSSHVGSTAFTCLLFFHSFCGLKMSCLPKPALRGHIKRRGLKSILGALCFGAVNSALFNFLVVNPRKEAYWKFKETYDAETHYKNLEKWGYLSFEQAFEELKREIEEAKN